MMHQKANRTLGCVGIGVFCAMLAGCAGGDTPRRDSDVLAAIDEFWGDETGAQGGSSGAGSGGTNGNSGSGNSGSGNSGSGNSGSGNEGGSGTGGSSVSTGGSQAAGAGGDGGGGAGCDGFAILVDKCGGGGCHGAGSGFSAFADTEDAAADFVGESASAACATNSGVIFDNANPSDSLVITKLDDPAPCGSPMPLGQVGTVSADEIACIEEWIGSL